MSYAITFTRETGYLHARLEHVEVTRESAEHIFREVVQACTSLHCHKVLIEIKGESRKISTMEMYDLGAHLEELGLRGTRIALVVDPSMQDADARFAENVAQNRGFSFRFFDRAEEARQWLQDNGVS